MADGKKKEDESIVKRTIKDSVFSDFFGMPKNLLKLYHTLHPEDLETKESDLQDITIQNILVNDIYNDLGFRVGDRLFVLVEAQSTWSMNIIIRILLYLATTYQKYIDDNNLDIYGSKKVELPEPELYVIFTGKRKDKPKTVTFSKEFFAGKKIAVEVKVKILYGRKSSKDVISQYVSFCKVYDSQRKIYGSTRKSITETIRICKDKNIMREYLESREKEVINMMMTLFDEEQIMKNHDAAIRKEEQEKGIDSIVDICKKMNGTIVDAIETVVSKYGYELEKAEIEVKKYW